MKYKVGDVVIIKSNITEESTGIENVSQYINKTARITKDVSGEGSYAYALDIDNEKWIWDKEWLELYVGKSYCPRCNSEIIWSADFSFEDYGIEGDGIVSHYTCSNSNCHTNIEVYTSDKEY